MSNLTRYVFGLAVILGYLAYYSVAQSQTKPIKKTLTGTVSGRVTINQRGSSFSFAPTGFQTDDWGIYRIFGVPAGLYWAV